MVGAAMGLVSSILGMIMSSQANKKSRGELDELAGKQTLSPALLSAEALLKEQATTGLPGYENQKAEIGSSTAQTINQMKDYVSGGGLIQAVADLTTKANARQRSLDDANNAAMLENKARLASFLGNTKAGAEYQLQDNLNSIATAKIGINQAGTQDALNFTNLGLNAIGNDRGLLAMINKLLGNAGGGKDGIPSNSLLFPQTPQATFGDELVQDPDASYNALLESIWGKGWNNKFKG